MRLPQSLVIGIPEPCHEDWDQMTPCEQGRFCASCQKTVIDFTDWSDARLYNFFSANQAQVCGRVLTTQRSRPITIPPQPHSRLYYIAVALGLALIFTQGNGVKTFARQPVVFTMPTHTPIEDTNAAKAAKTGIEGIVSDSKHEPIINASIRVMKDNKFIAGTITDYDGRYQTDNIDTGVYYVVVSYTGKKTQTITGVPVTKGQLTKLNFTMQSDETRYITGVLVRCYRPPLSDPYIPNKTTLRSDRLRHLGY